MSQVIVHTCTNICVTICLPCLGLLPSKKSLSCGSVTHMSATHFTTLCKIQMWWVWIKGCTEGRVGSF